MRILLPVDLSDRSREVVDLAIPWAERLHGVVDLLYVDETAIPLPHVRDPKVQKVLDEQWNAARQAQQAQLEALRERFPAESRRHVRLGSGPAAAAILDLASHFDLVMVGTHGRTGIDRMWLGSVAEKVVRAAPVPVLVLKLS
jgi:nucleotide-binding universal stress UspA family protein